MGKFFMSGRGWTASEPIFFFFFQEIISDLILAMKYLHETINLNASEVSNQEDC